MDQSEESRFLAATMNSGTVRVCMRSEGDSSRAWLALRDPARLSLWFGDLDGEWQPGRSGRVDFGDGDFFDVEILDVVESELVEFNWSFLGVGPIARIRWTVISVPEGTEVTVTDHQPDRTAAEVDELMAGWTDFLERLSRFLATGQTSRYGLRDEID